MSEETEKKEKLQRRKENLQRKKEKLERIMPNGIPRYVRCYDKVENFYNRYTIVFNGIRGRGKHHFVSNANGVGIFKLYLYFIDRPRYRHLGKKVKFETLPENIKESVIYAYKHIWKHQNNFP